MYWVTVQNVDDSQTPELRGMDDFDVVAMGQQSLNSQQITFDNGVVRQIVHRGREYQYRLTPKKSADACGFPPRVLKVDGKTLAATELQLAVVAPKAQDVAVVEVTADHATVYPTQPFTVTLSVLVKELPSPLSDRDPLSVQKPPPVLHIPWLADPELPDGLAAKEDWQSWVKQFIDSGGTGLGINGLAAQLALSFFGETIPALAFRPKPQAAVRRGGRRGDQVPPLRFPPGVHRQAIGLGYLRPGDPARIVRRAHGGPGTAGGQGCLYRLQAAGDYGQRRPKEGRPDNYLGAIGHFRLEADLSPRQAKVGDPMTFTLTVRGPGSLSSASRPI